MTKVEAVVTRERVETVIDAVETETGHVGVTVVEAIGHGRQRGVTHEYRGRIFESRFLPKALLTFIVEDDLAKAVVAAITDAARSGHESGDGITFGRAGAYLATALPANTALSLAVDGDVWIVTSAGEILRFRRNPLTTTASRIDFTSRWQGETPHPTAVQAVGMSVQQNVESAGLIVQTIWGLITRETSPKQLMGPVAIAQLSGETAQLGWIALANLMAMISLNLGLINLLPVPVMDGGQIAILAFEGLTRRDLSIRVKERILMAGAVLIVALMATVIYNDIMRLLR